MRLDPVRQGRGAARGVTLLELIVAVSILATVAALLWGTFSRTWATRQYAESRADTYAVARAAMSWIARDIAACGATRTYPDGKILFVSSGLGREESTDVGTPLLDFTTTSALGTAPLEFAPAADVPMPGPQRGEQARVLYRLEREKTAARDSPMSLVRYEWRPAADAERDEASRAVIVRTVHSIRLRFSNDGKDWRESWDTRASGLNHAPSVVETRLTLIDSENERVEFLSATSLPMGGRRRE
jgi:prepilin-type N-terminal cleavage/methylation domain-containing protein